MKNILLPTICFILGLFIQPTQAQQTAYYKDAQSFYKRGQEFYAQQLYGKAKDEWAQMLALVPTANVPEWRVLQQKAELGIGLAELQLANPDAERDLLTFIYRYEPADIASQAKLGLGNYYFEKDDFDKTLVYLGAVPNQGMNNADIVKLRFRIAYAHFAKKEYKKAEPLFKQIKTVKGDYYEPANYYYGLLCFYENDFGQALESFKLVAEDKKYQYNTVVPVYICQIYFQTQKYDEVISYGQPLTKDDKIKEQAQLAQLIGQAYFEKGNYAQALPYLEMYLEKSGKVSEEFLYQIAYTQYRTGNYDKAVKNFEQLNGLDSELGQNALYNMADCYLKTDNKTSARLAFQKSAAMNYSPKVKSDAIINFAKLSYEQGADAEAIQALQQIDNKSTYYDEAQNLLSEIFLNTRDYETALRSIRAIPNKSAQIKTTQQKLAYFRAMQLYKDKKTDESLKLLDESLQSGTHEETTALAHFWKGEIFYQNMAWDKSEAEYKKHAAIAPRLKQIPPNSSLGVAQYALGYISLKKGEVRQAGDYYEKAVEEIEKNHLNKTKDEYLINQVYPDALLKAGDCFLYQNSYAKADRNYKKIIDNKLPNTDYALYQQSIVLHLTNQPEAQRVQLDKLIKNYPSSLYADDALYAMGNNYMTSRSYDLARQSYAKINESYPNSDYADRSLLKQGIIAYSQGQNEQALRYYEAVFRNNPQSEEAKDAAGLMEEIYVAMGNPDGYFNFLGTIQGYSVNETARDSVMYRSAERKFKASEWAAAAEGFSKYLERYPTGLNSLQGRFYRAEALYELKRYEEALKDYNFLSEQNNPNFAETVNLRAGRISYNIAATRNFAEAAKYYARLEKYASTETNRYEAQLFGLRAAYFGNTWGQVAAAADKLIKNPRAVQSEKAEAHFYLAKTQQANKQNQLAKDNYKQNIALAGDEASAAEARYQIALMTYQERDLAKAQDMCFQTNKEIPNHPFWLVKSFVLLSDIYAEQGNLFQAKATLESIVNNFKPNSPAEEALLQEAKTKLVNVKKAEADKSKLDNNKKTR